MNTPTVHHLAIEENIKMEFGFDTEIRQIIADEIPIGRSGAATIFLTKKKQLFVFVHAEQQLLLSDVKKIISRMGLAAELFMPPKNRPSYFDDLGKEKFKEVFPGRTHISGDDIAFYRTLAPYNPGLILIKEVRHGVIYQWDADTKNSWRPSVKFAYRRISTS